MNKTQWVIITLGVVLLGLTLLRPPRTLNVRALGLPPGTRYVYSIYPNGEGLPVETDWPRLTATLAVIMLVTSGVVFALRSRGQTAA